MKGLTTDEYIEITINGVDLLMPIGSSVEDALNILNATQKAETIGTVNVDPVDAEYILLLQDLASDQMMQFAVDADEKEAPFFLLDEQDYDLEFFNRSCSFATTQELHQHLRHLLKAPVKSLKPAPSEDDQMPY